MKTFELLRPTPGLLVSVRDSAEAVAALAGGVDVIDVKEPSQGSLGAADDQTIGDIVAAVGHRALVSAALGELVDLLRLANDGGAKQLVAGVSLFKVGLAGCTELDDWQTSWHRTMTALAASSPAGTARPVAVVYADWQSARAPAPREVLTAAVEGRCPALLIDTYDKSAGGLFEHWSAESLRSFLMEVRSQGLATVLAGSLTGDAVVAAARLMPDLIAVRTAACDGGRQGTVSERRVRELKNAIGTATRDMAIAS